MPHADVIYFCSPNNPTGAVASREQLEALVAHANEKVCAWVFAPEREESEWADGRLSEEEYIRKEGVCCRGLRNERGRDDGRH